MVQYYFTNKWLKQRKKESVRERGNKVRKNSTYKQLYKLTNKQGYAYSILSTSIFFAFKLASIGSSSWGVSTKTASPELAYRAVLPTRWIYVVTSSGQSICTTQSTAGISVINQINYHNKINIINSFPHSCI